MIPGLDKLSDADLYALCVWAEARGESLEGQQAVAWVIRNRWSHPCWWGHDLKSVILTPWQFSWTQTSNPEHIDPAHLPDLSAFKKIVQDVTNGVIPDPTDGSVLYFADYMKPWPKWACKSKFTVQIGQHRFYQEA